MKKILLLLACMTLAPLSWAVEIDRPHISVWGHAKKEVVPDEMHWQVTVANRGAELAEVSKTHTNLVKEVLTIMRKSASSEKDIQTSGMRFGENYVYRNNSRVKEGYNATTSISLKMTNFKHYEPLWLSLSTFPSVSVTNVSYDYSKKDEVRNDTRVKALLAAKEKVNTLAKAMGSEVGETIVIEEDEGNSVVFPAQRMLMAESADGSDSPVSPGTIFIEAKIKLVVGLIAK